jgi:hypothetical protein
MGESVVSSSPGVPGKEEMPIIVHDVDSFRSAS